MSNITYKSVKIEITYSNSETERLGVKVGDKFEASQEYLNGKPKMQCWFNVNGTDCVAYACQHDEDAQIKITTCKILKK
ncbi:MAG: hypothetical protein J0M25_00805 [Flavobacteriales bacterium]|nr:hypothetical protein [Flavobacteriales bacterium]